VRIRCCCTQPLGVAAAGIDSAAQLGLPFCVRPISSFPGQDLAAPIGQCIVGSESGGGRHRRFPLAISSGIGAHPGPRLTHRHPVTHTQEWAPRHTQPSFLDPYTHISSQRLVDVPHRTAHPDGRIGSIHTPESAPRHTHTHQDKTRKYIRAEYSSQIHLRHTHKPSIGFHSCRHIRQPSTRKYEPK